MKPRVSELLHMCHTVLVNIVIFAAGNNCFSILRFMVGVLRTSLCKELVQCSVFIPLQPDSVSEGFAFSGCPARLFVRSSVRLFVRSSGQLGLLLPRYLVNALDNFDKTNSEYSLAHIDDLIRFWRSKIKVTAGRRDGKGIHVDAEASKSIFCFQVDSLTESNKAGLQCPSVRPCIRLSVHKKFL